MRGSAVNTKPFQIDLIGGPVDGLRVAVRWLPDRTVLMPPECVIKQVGFATSNATRRAQYEFKQSRFHLDDDRLPVVALRYEFVGSKPPRRRSPVVKAVVALFRYLEMGRGLPALARLQARLAAWMTEPVHYPLKLVACAPALAARHEVP